MCTAVSEEIQTKSAEESSKLISTQDFSQGGGGQDVSPEDIRISPPSSLFFNNLYELL